MKAEHENEKIKMKEICKKLEICSDTINLRQPFNEIKKTLDKIIETDLIN